MEIWLLLPLMLLLNSVRVKLGMAEMLKVGEEIVTTQLSVSVLGEVPYYVRQEIPVAYKMGEGGEWDLVGESKTWLLVWQWSLD